MMNSRRRHSLTSSARASSIGQVDGELDCAGSAARSRGQKHIVSAEPFSMSESTARLGRIAILWRGDEAARRSATADTGRFKAVFAALADVGVDAEPVVYGDNVLDAVRAQLATVDGVLVWVNPIHEGRNRANLYALLREVAGRGVRVSAHPDVILKMGTKEVLHRTCTMSLGQRHGPLSNGRGDAGRIA